MTPKEIQIILENHKKWIQGNGGSRANLYGADLTRADLTGADLTRANLTRADLTRAYLYGADLTRANLTRANLYGADLYGANLSGANLTGAYLTGANLSRAYLTRADLYGANLTGANLTGEPWEDYLEKVIPALLTAGGKTIEQIINSGCWECHDWSNCPMHEAFNIDNPSQGPPLLRPRIEQFVQLFDAGLIPCPILNKPNAVEIQSPE